MQLAHKILKTISRYDMMKKGDKVLIAVSGGADSVFLLSFLNDFKRKLGIKLYVAHMDHGIRGPDSRRDALFVRKMAGSLGVRFIYKKLNSRKNLDPKLSLEENLREARYNFFKNAAKKTGARVVTTAHTLDDQAETVFMRILKGSSLKGLVGVHPVRVDGNTRFIRPLIEIEKKDIKKLLKEKNIPYRVDKTNFDDKFLRNRVRNKIFPYLQRVNPRIKRALFNLAESLREDYEFIREENRRKLSLLKGSGPENYISLCDILAQPKALRKEITREALKRAGANIKKLTFRHWKDIDNFIRCAPSNKSIDLPGAVKMKKSKERLIFSK